jgi:uncharacterized DUF497 family protein
MELEWDEAKNQQNIGKHGIDFQDAQLVFERPFTIRIISVRKASKHERQIYQVKIASFPD